MSLDLLGSVRSELDARLAELRPLVSEYDRLLAAAVALGEPQGSAVGDGAPEPRLARRRRARRVAGPSRSVGASRGRSRARRGAAQQAILGALEHGSHTAAELVSVTALAGSKVRGDLRRLVHEGTITLTKRAGRTAYTLR
jgi:hypothetical protein